MIRTLENLDYLEVATIFFKCMEYVGWHILRHTRPRYNLRIGDYLRIAKGPLFVNELVNSILYRLVPGTSLRHI